MKTILLLILRLFPLASYGCYKIKIHSHTIKHKEKKLDTVIEIIPMWQMFKNKTIFF